MTTTAFSGPVATFTQQNDGTNHSDIGYCVLSQVGTLTQNSTTAVSYTFYVPQGSQIVDIFADTTTAWNSVTSAVLTVGQAAAGTQYASAVDVTSAGRVIPTYTATQLGNMQDVSTHVAVVATVTPTGATSAGTTVVTLQYVQKP